MSNGIPQRTMVVTGGAGGLGLATAEALIRRGDHVILADRDEARGEQAAAKLRALRAGAEVQFRSLDLADLTAVATFAEALAREMSALDGLINIAGILPPPTRQTTRDGFELKFGLNHLGHFALTCQLLPLLLAAPAARVVSIASLVAAHGRLDFSDLQAERRYDSQRVYAQAKLACLMFALELDRRCRAAGHRLLSVAAHPGIARTGIGRERAHSGRRPLRAHLEEWAMRFAMRHFGQSSEDGALPIIHAATAADVRGGSYFGPAGFMQFRGRAREVAIPRSARDPAQWGRLWSVSADLTGLDCTM